METERSTGSTDLDDSKEGEAFREIYKFCEEAYANGVDSVDIYNLLHSKPIIKQAVIDAAEKRKKTENSNDCWGKLLLNYLRAALGGIWGFLKRLDVILFRLTLVLLLLLCSALTVCHVIDLNPLIYFPSLADKQCLIPAHPLLLEMVRPVEDCGVCRNYLKTNSVVIEFTEAPSETEFLQVAYLSRPVLVRGAAFKNGMPIAFDFTKLRKLFESEPGGVDSVSEECQFLPFRSPFNTLREAFHNIDEVARWDQPWYIGWSNCHPGVASKLRELFPRPKFLPHDSESSAIDWIFIGSPGLGASMHIDYVRRPSWQAQLSGTKHWVLKPPPECENQCTGEVQFTINPGDMVFLDTNVWFHETQIMGSQLSISIGSEYD